MNKKNNSEKIDWKRKLSSRKLWAAAAAFVTAIMAMFGCSESEIAQVTAIIMSGATFIAYIIGEGLVDANRVNEPQPQQIQQFPKYDCDEEPM